MSEAPKLQADVAVVGAGGAGLYAALSAAAEGATVALISATPLARTASYWAQGGIAAALAPDDSPDLHRHDTEVAGRGLVRPSAAAVLCREAARVVTDLERLGVVFDLDSGGDLALGLEGGHSRRRVVHAGGSATGRRIVRQLSALVAEDRRIHVLEHARAATIWLRDGRSVGLVCEDGRVIAARGVVLATGGAAALWSRTTNPPGSVGIGALLAQAAGAAIADLELVQFHPTAVAGVPGREGFLVTEAIRGEGATIVDHAGERFVAELAPRDEVARAIETRMREAGAAHMWLDMRAVDPGHFPNIVSALQESGLDPTRELVPVSPAAHYVMGGVVTDLDGATTVPGLYAVGEAACTGLHGANRLASNSLTECFVFGQRAGVAALAEPQVGADGDPPAPEPIAMPTRATREHLWRDAGLVRCADGLRTLLDDPHPLARIVAECALLREESRGGHQRADFPDTDPGLDGHHAVIRGDDAPTFEPWV
jgi:L-aspartate oxidase